jgi:hypothetical protein
MPQALTPLHCTRPHVSSAVTGETGRARIRALRAGARNPVPVARRRHARGPHAAATSATAPPGQWRAEPRWAWAQAVARDARDHAQRAACARQRAARRGTPKASPAPAPQLARVIATRLQPGTASVRPRRAASAQSDRARTVQSVTRRAKAWGEAVGKTPARTPA